MFPIVQRASEEGFEPRQSVSFSTLKALFGNQTANTPLLPNSCLKIDVLSPEEIAEFFAPLDRGLPY